MIYDLKMLFEPNLPQSENFDGYEVTKDLKIDENEIALIESKDLPKQGNEEAQKKVDLENDTGLRNIKEQAVNILNSTDSNIQESEIIKAIQTLLRIYAMENDMSNDDMVIQINGNVESLKKVFGDADAFMNSSIQLGKIPGWGAIVVEKMKSYFGIKKGDYRDEAEYNSVHNELGNEETVDFTRMDERHAVDFLKDLINGNNAEQDLKKFYAQYQEEGEYPEKIKAALKVLIDKIVANGEENSKIQNFRNGDNVFDSNLVKAIQTKYQEEYQESENYAFGSMKYPVDGKLGRATITALIQMTELNDVKKPKNDFNIQGTGKRQLESVENLKYGEIKKMPTSMEEFSNYGIWKGDKFSFYGQEGNEENKGDFVGKDEKGEFVKIDGKKYHIDTSEGGAGEDIIRTKRESVTYLVNGQEVTEYVDVISIGTFNEKGILVEGKEIKSDKGNQQSTEFYGNKKRGKDEEESHFGTVTLGEKPEGSKWRIDLFSSEGVDSKRLSDDQLDSLDTEDISKVLEQAVHMYDITKHKPSEVGRYNLNRIVYRVLRDTKVYDDLARDYGTQFDTPKTASHMILGMDTGFYTNPDKQLKEKHIENKDNVVAKILGVNLNGLEGYKEIKGFNENTKKGEQIKNRLTILKAFVNSDVAKRALNKQTE